MSFLKKTWLARIGVGLNRFRMNNSTDVVLESNPISVTQQGDQLSADNMNNLETRIDNAFTEMAGNLAPIELSPATTNHAVGTQLVYNGILYKVTSAISTGNNLVVGSNISPYPVSSAISDIIDSFDFTSAQKYVRFGNGLQVCWGMISYTVTSWNAWGSAYQGLPAPQPVNFAQSFLEAPSVTVSPNNNGTDGSIMSVGNETNGQPTKTNTGKWFIMRPSVGNTNITVGINYIAIGRWK